MMIQEPIELDAEQMREVYARFGFATYQAQCLERQLAIILATKYGPEPTRISSKEFSSVFEDLFSKSLGQLVRKITKFSDLSKDVEGRLQEALETRNWLTHRYFWERALDILSVAGRAKMIDELRAAADLLHSQNEFFTTKTDEYGKRFGINQRLIGNTSNDQSETENLIRNLRGAEIGTRRISWSSHLADVNCSKIEMTLARNPAWFRAVSNPTSATTNIRSK